MRWQVGNGGCFIEVGGHGVERDNEIRRVSSFVAMVVKLWPRSPIATAFGEFEGAF